MLSDAQLNALTPRQLDTLQTNGKIRYLDISKLNPTNLAHMILTFENKGNEWSHGMVYDLTTEQCQAILDSNSPHLDEYFSLKAQAKMRAKSTETTVQPDTNIDQRDFVATAPPLTAPIFHVPSTTPTIKTDRQEPTIVQKALTAFKSTWFGKLINNKINQIHEYVNQESAKRTAKTLAQIKAEDNMDAQNQVYFNDAMKKLNTKEKEDVANIWLNSKTKAFQEEQEELKQKIIILQNEAQKINDNPDATKEDQTEYDHYQANIIQLSNTLHDNMERFSNQREAFLQEIQTTLQPNEDIIELHSTQAPHDIAFEIINMHNINPRMPIADQYNSLVKDKKISKPTLSAGKIGQMTQQAILNAYTKWITNNITIVPDNQTSVLEQLNVHMLLLTNIPFDQCNKSIQKAIIQKLPKDIQKLYHKEVKQKKINDNFLKFSPETIETKIHPNYIKKLSPDTIAHLSDKQTQALTSDQLQALSIEQLAKLPVIDLLPSQVPDVIETLTTNQINSLSDQQVSKVDINEPLMPGATLLALAPKITDTNMLVKFFSSPSKAKLKLEFLTKLSAPTIQTLPTEIVTQLTQNMSDPQIEAITQKLPQDSINQLLTKLEDAKLLTLADNLTSTQMDDLKPDQIKLLPENSIATTYLKEIATQAQEKADQLAMQHQANE